MPKLYVPEDIHDERDRPAWRFGLANLATKRRDDTVHAFFAAGNGGQIVMGIPELDLLIAFYGGNYSDAVLYRAQNVLIPEYILKSVH